MHSLKEITDHLEVLLQAYSYREMSNSPLHRNKNTEFIVRRGVLYITGSNDMTDWYQNAKGVYVRRRTVAGGGAHEGFAEHADTVMTGVGRLGIESRGIKMVVGHSLGGAAAQIIGARLGIPVITFGSPRVWRSSELPRALPDGYYHTRVWNRADPVVSLPTRLRWSHVEHQCLSFGPGWLRGLLWRLFHAKPFLYHHFERTYLKEVRLLEKKEQGLD